MSYESLLFWIIIIAIVLLLAWLAAKWFVSQRVAQTEQILESSAGTIWQAEEAASYLHNGLGTLPFPTIKEQIGQKLAAPVQELSEEVRRWKGKCQEIKPKLEEMDRKLESLRYRLDQVPASIGGLPTDREVYHKAQWLREVCISPKVADLDQISIEIQQVIDRTDSQIEQIEAVTAEYYRLEANLKAINNWLSRISHTLEQLQTTAVNIKLCSEGRAECEHIRNEVERWIGPITANRTIVELKDHSALSERLEERAKALAERFEAFL